MAIDAGEARAVVSKWVTGKTFPGSHPDFLIRNACRHQRLRPCHSAIWTDASESTLHGSVAANSVQERRDSLDREDPLSIRVIQDPPEAGASCVSVSRVSAPRAADTWQRHVKAPAEWLVALAIVIVLLPLLVALWLLVRITTGSPVLYRRRVVGRDGVEFDAFKFRTMVNGAERILEQDDRLREAFMTNWKLFDDPRVTSTGRILRKFSLDELPQLFNVLRGEMSLIGPRMITAAEVPRYGPLGQTLLSVRPGLTGLWQVSGRQTVSYERRIELDMHYIATCSPVLDLSILLRTIPVAIRGDGAF